MKLNRFQNILPFRALFYEACNYVCSEFKRKGQFLRVLVVYLIINKQASDIYLIPKQFAMETTRQDSLIRCLRGTW